jgi:membrane protease YdiL (CAAX protease family)
MDERVNPPEKRHAGRAGLLWRLLGPAGRARVAPELRPDEIEALGPAYQNQYRNLPRARRRQIEQGLHRILRERHSPLPMLLSLVLAIIAVAALLFHFVQMPGMSVRTRSTLFTPLLLTVLAPLALYLLPRYRLYLLFRPVPRVRTIGSAVAAFVALLWVLYFIDLEQGAHLRLDPFSLIILTLGAFGAPLLEELVFRELLPGLVGRPPHYAGHFLSMVAFALAHFPATATMFALYFIAACVLSEVRIRSDGLLYGFAAHALANITILLL